MLPNWCAIRLRRHNERITAPKSMRRPSWERPAEAATTSRKCRHVDRLEVCLVAPREVQPSCRFHRTSAVNGDNMHALKLPIATLVTEFMVDPNSAKFNNLTEHCLDGGRDDVTTGATILRVTGVDGSHCGEPLRSLANLVAHVDRMTYTVLAASISNNFKGRLSTHWHEVFRRIHDALRQKFQYDETRVTVKPTVDVGDATGSASRYFRNRLQNTRKSLCLAHPAAKCSPNSCSRALDTRWCWGPSPLTLMGI